ncbi:MAG: peptidylprolyl isomerase [Cyanothece sp. SIO1E1]|nr:peptidylprolyl isomerase [Cyanothece sp. SIO1E1]
MAVIKRWLRAGILAFLFFTMSLGLSAAQWNDFENPTLISYLAPGDAITDGRALLRNALPFKNDEIRQIQASLENISTQLRGKRWSGVKRDLGKVSRVLSFRAAELIESVPEIHQAEAESLIDQLKEGLISLKTAAEATDKSEVLLQRNQMLDVVETLEYLMVSGFPFEVPPEYGNLPQLKGRATVDFKTAKGSVTAVLDGYSAPVTAGNFLDLVQRGFYDGLEFTRAEDSYVLQIGDPPGPEVGFIDPASGEYRAIPLEILVQGEAEPVYEFTLEEIGLYSEQPKLPFSAYGALAMARPGDDPNGASSQFFFFLFDRELTPPGFNLLDGRYAIFGYVTEGKDVLGQLKAGDKIDAVEVVKGIENLVEPST